jgi:hypothetical protein
VHCYDDHRVAMAFSVLSTVIENTIIEEKRCVEKTWPNWWDDLENKVRRNFPSFPMNANSSRLVYRSASRLKVLTSLVSTLRDPRASPPRGALTHPSS